MVRALTTKGRSADLVVRTREELDLTHRGPVDAFFAAERPSVVILAAAKAGGIYANSHFPVEFMNVNLDIQLNVMQSAAKHGTEKLLFLGSSCVYPRMAPQPILEDSLLTSSLEETNEAYALAKISGLKLCQYYRKQYGKNFISVMPTNLYGPFDNFHPSHSHVIPGLLRRFHEAKLARQSVVNVWGSGTPLREFLHVDDLAEASLLVLERWNDPMWINIGSGTEVTIRELAHLIKQTVGFPGDVQFDASYPDGTPRKIMNSDRMRSLGWRPRITLEEGLKTAYDWALATGAFTTKRLENS